MVYIQRGEGLYGASDALVRSVASVPRSGRSGICNTAEEHRRKRQRDTPRVNRQKAGFAGLVAVYGAWFARGIF